MNTLIKTIKDEIEKGDYANALKHLDCYIANHENSAEAYAQRGDLNRLLKNIQAAIDDFTSSINIEPHNPVYFHKRAEMKEEQEDYVGALNDYHKAYDQSLKISKYNSLSVRYWNNYDCTHQILIEKNRAL